MIKKRNINNLLWIIFTYSIFYSCVSIKKGTFTIVEKGKDIGYLYRYKDFQIERYYDDDDLVFGKIRWINKREMLLNSLYQSGNPIDTLTWKISFSKTNNRNHYNAIGKLAYIDSLNYKYEFKTEKISNRISEDIKEVILQTQKDFN